MNELLTNKNGRMPFVLNDIRFLDSIYRNAILAIIGGLNKNENLIVSGISLENTEGEDYTAIGGVIYFNGELLTVNDSDITIPTGYKAVIEKKEAFDPSGLKLFGDGTLVDTYKLIYGEFSVVLISQTGQFEVTSKRLDSLFKPNFTENTAFNRNFGAGTLNVERGSNNDSQIIKKIREIGGWNMYQDSSKVVYFEPLEGGRVVGISGIIYNDEGTERYVIGSSDVSGNYIESSIGAIAFDSVIINRRSSGMFYSVNYNDPAINRGYIKVEYLPF